MKESTFKEGIISTLKSIGAGYVDENLGIDTEFRTIHNPECDLIVGKTAIELKCCEHLRDKVTGVGQCLVYLSDNNIEESVLIDSGNLSPHISHAVSGLKDIYYVSLEVDIFNELVIRSKGCFENSSLWGEHWSQYGDIILEVGSVP